MKPLPLFVGFVLILAAAGTLQAQHVDVRPYVAGGKLVTGSAQLNGPVVTPLSDETRVFGVEFGEDDPAQPFFTEDPGFLSEHGTFPGGGGKYVGFDVSAGLRHWTGSGFGAVPAGESLQITKGSQSVNVAGAGIGGYWFGIIGVNENIHEHLTFELLGADGNPIPGDGVEPTPGIWLLEMTLRTSMPGVAVSDPLWIVFNSGGEDFESDHEAASAWVESHLVPEPASAILIAFGAGLISRRRNRRS
ncbi:MAG TPA: PEP-CTERM sorting domain-containing protein [Phycisphaerae bacterium]|nr:PEP-CTERM sorting domain-containing protein [Phycisphaerae bacterium]